MKISKHGSIEKGDDSKITKNEDIIFAFFGKLRKVEFRTYIAYVIVLTIYFQSVIVTYKLYV